MSVKKSGAKPAIWFISSNPEKIEEVRFLLAPFGITLRAKKMEFAEPQAENAGQVATAKARQAFQRIRKPVLVEDTAIRFTAYPNFPGIYAAYAFRALGFEGLLKLVRGKKRDAEFETVAAFYDGKTPHPLLFPGICKGRLASRPAKTGVRGMRFPYERIFIPAGYSRPVCQLPASEKAKFSHRGKAMRAFARWFLRQRR